jgi:hypothetical protein
MNHCDRMPLLERNRNNHSLLISTTTINPLRREAKMVDSFFLQIDWTIVAMVIGLLASLIAVFFSAAPIKPVLC